MVKFNTAGTSAELFYIHNDHLATPQKITNTSQQVVWAADYEPFGKATVTTSTIYNHTRFPGQFYDSESGLHYNYFRDYDPEIGRYIQSDPIGLGDGVNTYAYVGGNPISYSDSTGQLRSLAGRGTSVGGSSIGGAGAGYAFGQGGSYDFGQGGESSIWPNYRPATGNGNSFNQSRSRADRTPEEEAAADKARDEYHQVCDKKPPDWFPPCELARWKRNQAQHCYNLRKKWEERFGVKESAAKHREQLEQVKKRICNAVEEIKQFCVDEIFPKCDVLCD